MGKLRTGNLSSHASQHRQGAWYPESGHATWEVVSTFIEFLASFWMATQGTSEESYITCIALTSHWTEMFLKAINSSFSPDRRTFQQLKALGLDTLAIIHSRILHYFLLRWAYWNFIKFNVLTLHCVPNWDYLIFVTINYYKVNTLFCAPFTGSKIKPGEVKAAGSTCHDARRPES